MYTFDKVRTMQKWETHLHTKKGSRCGAVSPRKVAKIYAEAGYDGIVVTNHFNLSNFEEYFRGRKINWVDRYLKEYRLLKKHCEKYGVTVILGLEMSLVGDERRADKDGYSELLVFGVTPEQLRDYNLSLLYHTQEEFFDICENEGWICGQSHPFREGIIPLDFRYMHLLETYNGHTRHVNNNEIAVKTAEEYGLIPTDGSDFHIESDFGCGMLFPDDMVIKTESDFVAALRSRRGEFIKR